MFSMDGLRTRLAGRYQLDEVIGRGGMNTVYRATDAVLDCTVAVKVLSPALAEGDPVWVARLQREARAAASLNHPGVATVYDTGFEDGTRFIVMEWVPGKSLATILHDEAPLDPARAVRIAAQVADALSAAHAAGIVHRDIKPGNVIVAPDGTVKVLDLRRWRLSRGSGRRGSRCVSESGSRERDPARLGTTADATEGQHPEASRARAAALQALLTPVLGQRRAAEVLVVGLCVDDCQVRVHGASACFSDRPTLSVCGWQGKTAPEPSPRHLTCWLRRLRRPR
jgi:hypothetical protein